MHCKYLSFGAGSGRVAPFERPCLVKIAYVMACHNRTLRSKFKLGSNAIIKRHQEWHVYLLRKSKDFLIPGAGLLFLTWVVILFLTVPPSDSREEMLSRAHQSNTAAHVENWAASPERTE